MALSFAVKPTDGSGSWTVFDELSVASGRYALDIDPGCPIQDIRRFHVPGVAGNAVLRAGSVGRTIHAAVRYVGDDVVDALASYKSDVEAWAVKQMDILFAGEYYYGCNLDTAASKRSTPIRPTGRTPSQVYFDVSLTFNQDNENGIYP